MNPEISDLQQKPYPTRLEGRARKLKMRWYLQTTSEEQKPITCHRVVTISDALSKTKPLRWCRCVGKWTGWIEKQDLEQEVEDDANQFWNCVMFCIIRRSKSSWSWQFFNTSMQIDRSILFLNRWVARSSCKLDFHQAKGCSDESLQYRCTGVLLVSTYRQYEYRFSFYWSTTESSNAEQTSNPRMLLPTSCCTSDDRYACQ